MNLLRTLADLFDAPARLDLLEARMSATENAINDLDQATNEVAAEIDDLRASVSKFDSDTATRLGVVAARLRGLASDPDEVVPAPPVEPDAPVVDAPEAPAEPTPEV